MIKKAFASLKRLFTRKKGAKLTVTDVSDIKPGDKIVAIGAENKAVIEEKNDS